MKKNFFYTVLLSIVNILFPVLSFPYASHILGPEGIGKVQFVVSLAQYFALFAALGIPIYGIKEIARYRDDPKKLALVFTELTSIFLIASIVLSGIYVTMLYAFPFFEADRQLYMYGGLLIILSFSYTDWLYSGIEEFGSITLRSILIKSISLVLLYILVKTKADFKHYLFIIIFSILGNQLLSFAMVFRKVSFSFKGVRLKKHFKPLIYILSATMAASVYTVLDSVLLGFLSDNASVGLYTAAIKLIKITIPIITAMGVILIPSISKKFSTGNMGEIHLLWGKSIDFIIFLSIPMCFGLAILAPEFISVFSGERFIGATTSMQLLSVLPILIGFGHFFCFLILMPSGKNREIFLSMLTGVIICLLLNFLLVPSLRDKGAAIANVCTEISVTAAYIYFVRKHHSLTYNWKLVWQSIMASVLFFPVILLIRHFSAHTILTLLTSIILCVGLYTGIHLLVFRNSFLYGFIQTLKSKLKATK